MTPQATSPRRTLLTFLVVGSAFALGATLDRTGLLPGSPAAQPPGLQRTFAPFWETWDLVDRYYVDRAAVKPEAMTRGAIEGMLESLGDVGHTTYLSAEEMRQLERNLQGSFEGIGARMTMRKGQATVVDVLPNSPARAAGLKVGDVLTEVDGKDVGHLLLTRIVQLVRGPSGSSVRVQVRRPSVAEPLTFEIKRAKVDVADVSSHLLPGTSIAHVAIQDFGEHSGEQLRAALIHAKESGATGIILDLRGNAGGLKDQAVAVTSEFIRAGTVFIEQDAEGQRTAVPVTEGGVATDIPLVVLIDEGTASSSEIVSGALQDYHRAQLVGTKTFGTGTVLKPFPLQDGSAVLLAVLEWFTPKGRQIWHKGITPDVEVSLPADVEILLPYQERDLTSEELKRSPDAQLLKAIQVLQRDLAKP